MALVLAKTVLIDFEKAFDSVNRDTLWICFKHHGIPDKIAKLTRAAYVLSTCQVVHDGSLTDSFEVLTGVQQGCIVSPFLFLLAMDWIMKKTTEGHKSGIQWTLFSHLEAVDFAYDVALLSHRHSDMEDKSIALSETSGRRGLKVNSRKNKTS